MASEPQTRRPTSDADRHHREYRDGGVGVWRAEHLTAHPLRQPRCGPGSPRPSAPSSRPPVSLAGAPHYGGVNRRKGHGRTNCTSHGNCVRAFGAPDDRDTVSVAAASLAHPAGALLLQCTPQPRGGRVRSVIAAATAPDAASAPVARCRACGRPRHIFRNITVASRQWVPCRCLGRTGATSVIAPATVPARGQPHLRLQFWWSGGPLHFLQDGRGIPRWSGFASLRSLNPVGPGRG